MECDSFEEFIDNKRKLYAVIVSSRTLPGVFWVRLSGRPGTQDSYAYNFSESYIVICS